MRAVIQVARDASVTVEGEIVGSYSGLGLVVLVGITDSDGPAAIETVARKIAQLRILPEEKSADETDSPILLISQFTLYGQTKKGRRPSWSHAAKSDVARPIFDKLVDAVRDRGLHVETGVFGAHMDVQLTNVGPFTVLVEA